MISFKITMRKPNIKYIWLYKIRNYLSTTALILKAFVRHAIFILEGLIPTEQNSRLIVRSRQSISCSLTNWKGHRT